MTNTTDSGSSVGRGRYLLGTELGRGGTAVVLRGWDTVLHRHVAVKLLRDLIMDPSAEARFEAEGKLLAALDHPGLITVFDAGIEDDRPFLVMEIVDGQTLAARLERGPLPPGAVAGMGAALAEVLSHIHSHGVTHRDVKPSNVLIDSDGGVRLADFGIARHGDAARQTATGLTIGTAAYLSPEQASGESGAPPSDIYALGLVLLEALTGRPAFTGPPQAVALARLLSPSDVPEELPPAYRHLLSAMTASTPADRPSAVQVRTRLESLSAARGQEAQHDTDVLPAPSPTPDMTPAGPGVVAATVPVSSPAPHRRRRVLAAAGGSVVLLLILFVPALMTGDDAARDADPGGSPPGVIRSPGITSSPRVPAVAPVPDPGTSQQPPEAGARPTRSVRVEQATAETRNRAKKTKAAKHKGHDKPGK